MSQNKQYPLSSLAKHDDLLWGDIVTLHHRSTLSTYHKLIITNSQERTVSEFHVQQNLQKLSHFGAQSKFQLPENCPYTERPYCDSITTLLNQRIGLSEKIEWLSHFLSDIEPSHTTLTVEDIDSMIQNSLPDDSQLNTPMDRPISLKQLIDSPTKCMEIARLGQRVYAITKQGQNIAQLKLMQGNQVSLQTQSVISNQEKSLYDLLETKITNHREFFNLTRQFYEQYQPNGYELLAAECLSSAPTIESAPSSTYSEPEISSDDEMDNRYNF